MSALGRNNIVEIVGILAVVASVLFVAFEIRQANRIAVGTTSYDIQRNYMTINELIMTDEEFVALLGRINSTGTDITDSDKIQARAYANRLLNQWTSVEEAHRAGLVSDTIFTTAAEDVIAIMKSRPGMLPIFREVLADYELSRYEVLAPLDLAVSE